MHCIERPARWLLVLTALMAVRAEAITEEGHDRSYQVIIDRNPFGLHPLPPPPPNAPLATPGPKVEIYLTGLTTFLGPKKAFLMTKEPKGEPKYYTLAEQEGRDGLDVLAIDEFTRRVRIRNLGEERWLDYTNNGLKSMVATAGPAPGAPGQPGAYPVPGAPAAPGLVPPPLTPGVRPVAPGAVSGVLPGAVSTASATSGIQPIPSRVLRTQPETQPAVTAQFSGNYNSGAAARTQPVKGPEPRLSPEEQLLMIELQRAANPGFPLPPTPGFPTPQAQSPGNQLVPGQIPVPGAAYPFPPGAPPRR